MFNINKLFKSLLGEESEAFLEETKKIGFELGKEYLKHEAEEWWENQQKQVNQSQTSSQRPLQAWQKIRPKSSPNTLTPLGTDPYGYSHFQASNGRRYAIRGNEKRVLNPYTGTWDLTY